jgi:ribosomal protein S18 acetylase RimI-like enzyme
MAAQIRPGRREDLEAVRDFTTGTFEWGDYVADQFTSWLDDPTAVVLVAVDPDDRAVAVARAALLSPREAWLAGARVHPRLRRQGIGSALNQQGAAWARNQGAQVIRLATEDNNAPARLQVEKLGYRAVARFALAQRHFEPAAPGANGGQRLPADEKLDIAPSSEAEPAYLVWASGDYPAASHGLYAAEGWAFRRLQAGDLVRAGKLRQLWSSPSAWAVVAADQEGLWLPLFVTTPDDASRAARALVDLGKEQARTRIAAMIPRIDWLMEALQAEHFTITHPNHIYEKPL